MCDLYEVMNIRITKFALFVFLIKVPRNKNRPSKRSVHIHWHIVGIAIGIVILNDDASNTSVLLESSGAKKVKPKITTKSRFQLDYTYLCR